MPWRFRSTLARSTHDHRRGYHAVGVAVARELPVLAPRLAAPEDVARLVAALAAADHRDVVRWLVRHARPIMRHVPRERVLAVPGWHRRGVRSDHVVAVPQDLNCKAPRNRSRV